MTEYWLQKKTIGGWSQVTWYDNQEQAMTNFNNVSKGDTGYSWRLVEANTVVEKLLEEIVEVPPPEFIPIEPRVRLKPVAATPMAAGWDKPMGDDPIKDTGHPTHGGKGQIWVVNRATAHKTKISPDQLQEFEAKGYAK